MFWHHWRQEADETTRSPDNWLTATGYVPFMDPYVKLLGHAHFWIIWICQTCLDEIQMSHRCANQLPKASGPWWENKIKQGKLVTYQKIVAQ